MLERLGRFVVRRRWAVLAAALVGVVVSAAVGAGVVSKLSQGGFEDPSSESFRADAALRETFQASEPNFLLVVTANEGSVNDPSVADAGIALTRELEAEPAVEQVVSYWTLGYAPPLRSSNDRHALVLARIAGSEDEVDDAAKRLKPKYTRAGDEVTVGVGGFAAVFREVGETIEADLARAEAISLPVTLLLLVVVFGSVVAAGLPIGIGAIAIVGTLLALRVIAEITQVSVYALNMTTAMGLGLGIDYALFVVSRFREELRRGLEPAAAVVKTVVTAGRTVAFSAVTVMASLVALVVFPLAFLRSFAYAGIAVVGLAGVAAVVVLPALLAALGTRVDKFTLFRRRRERPVDEGFWHRVAVFVMRRPVPVAGVVIAVLLLLGSPFLGIRFGLPDDRVLPASAEVREVHDTLRREFDANEAAATSVVAARIGDPRQHAPAIEEYAQRLSTIDEVSRVDALTGVYQDGRKVAELGPFAARFLAEDGTWLSVVPAVEPVSAEGEELVREVRAASAPFDVLVGGPSAQLVDAKRALFSRVPLAAAIVAAVSFLVLFLMFGSLLVPAKAVVLNLLSLSATFGSMVWIFQQGHLSGFLGFTPTGALDTTTPILMFCIAFGLSMDYEVFLLSRIKEEYDRTGDNQRAVALGLERTGRIVTAAALLIGIVFISFATSKVSFIKLFGIGLAMAVLMDATLIRAALVPAFMRLAGRANWWLPRPLRALHDRIGLSESVPEPEPAPEAAAPILVPVRATVPAAQASFVQVPRDAVVRRPASMRAVSHDEVDPAVFDGAAGGDAFLVTRDGEPVAVVLPYARPNGHAGKRRAARTGSEGRR